MKLIIFLTFLQFSGLLCNNHLDFLRRDSIIYGLATVNYQKAHASSCSLQLQQFVNAVQNQTLWAYKLIDTSGVPEEGFLWGNNFWLGRQTFCYMAMDRQPLQVSNKYPTYHNFTDDNFTPYSVEFFGAYIKHNFTLQTRANIYDEYTIDIGLCLPSVCENDEIAERLQLYLDERILSVQNLYDLKLKVSRIKNIKDDFRWMNTKKFFLMVTIVSFIIIMTIVGTTYDVIINQPKLRAKKRLEEAMQNQKIQSISEKISYKTTSPESVSQILQGQDQYKPPSKGAQFILCFSFYSNAKIIVRTKLGEGSIPCIHGLRFGSMIWVIMAHSMFYAGEFTSDRILAFIVSRNFILQPLANAQLSVDSFFFISGFLVSYLFYKDKLSKIGEKTFTVGKSIQEYIFITLNRYLRFTPIVVVAILVFSVIYEYFANTTIMEMGEAVHEKCSKYWWRNILYIGNLFDWNELCLSWSWYLSADMQFFLISLSLCFLSTFLMKTSLFLMYVLIIGSCIISTYIAYDDNFVPTYDETVNKLDYMYARPWIRIPPYLVGIITGYYAVKINGKLHIKKPILVLLWILGPLLNLYILFALVDRRLPLVYSALYAGLHRTLWGVGLAWLIIACITNNAGIINKVLSFRGFIPLSRLTFCAYLLNPFVVTFFNLNNEEGSYMTYIPVFVFSSADVYVTYLLAFFATVMIETPTTRLIKLCFTSLQKR